MLWCWLTGVFGIATKYAESPDRRSSTACRPRMAACMGGAMYALERGLKWKKFGKVMAVLFALFATLRLASASAAARRSTPLPRCMETNLNSISTAAYAQSALFSASSPLIVIIGGIESIASRVREAGAASWLLFYVVGCIVILCARTTILLLPRSQGHLRAGVQAGRGRPADWSVGGITSGSCSYGVARGLFSNESGHGFRAAGCQRGTDA